MEVWKVVPASNGYFEVSSLGRIRNRETGKILNRKATRRCCVGKHNGTVTHFSSLVILETFKGKEPEGYSHRIRYKDGDKTNWAIDNLEWVKKVEPRNAPDVVEKLVMENTGLVYKLVTDTFSHYDRINGYALHEDLIQEAYIGLMRAAQFYDTESGMPFGSYAWKSMERHIFSQVLKKDKDYWILQREMEGQKESLNIVAKKDGHGWESLEFLDLVSETDVKYDFVILDIVLKEILNERQLRMVKEMLSGKSDSEIAREEGISPQAMHERKLVIRKKVMKHYINQ